MLKEFKNKNWILFFACLSIVYCLIEAQGAGDFLIFLWAGNNLHNHVNIYDALYNESYKYYYSVLFAFILEPFYTLPLFGVKFIWLVLNIAAVWHLIILLLKSKWLDQLNVKQKKLFLIGFILFSLRFVHENIHVAQITILILWCCVYGLISIYKGESIKGSLLLALGINLKLLPLVFLPYLIYRKMFRETFYIIAFYFTLLFLPSILIGFDFNMELIRSWLKLINPSNSRHVLDVDERSFHGISTLLSTLLVKNVPDYYAMDLKRNILDVSLPVLEKILLLSRLILILITLYFLKFPPFKKSKNQMQTFFEIAFILLIIPLLFPHQQHYAFLFAVPAFLLIWYSVILFYEKIKYKWLTVSFLSICFLCCTLKIWLGEFNRYYEHYKILTYGILLLIPLLIWAFNQFERNRVKI